MIKKLVGGLIYMLKMDFKEGLHELKELRNNKYYQKN